MKQENLKIYREEYDFANNAFKYINVRKIGISRSMPTICFCKTLYVRRRGDTGPINKKCSLTPKPSAHNTRSFGHSTLSSKLYLSGAHRESLTDDLGTDETYTRNQ